jgi:hypothetical protein
VATIPLDLSKPDSIPRPQVNRGAAMVRNAVDKYVNYLVAKNSRDTNLLIQEQKRVANATMIETADMFYNRIPEEFR